MTSPPEVGGMGWPASEVKRLTLGEIIMYSGSKLGSKGGNMYESAKNVDPAKLAAAKEELKQRRIYYTGKSTL